MAGSYWHRVTLAETVVWELHAAVRLDGAGGGTLTIVGAPLVARLVSEPCHLGGVRWWALCPTCGRRRAKIYVHRGRLTCRACLGLLYECQREGRARRALLRVRALERRAGIPIGGLGPGGHWADRPRGMHHARWERLRARADDLDAIADAAFARSHGVGHALGTLERWSR